MERYKTILLFGAPGSGKGTQGTMLGQIPGFHHVSSGDIFRGIDQSSELGQLFHQYASRGELVPDEITIRVWSQAMLDRQAAGTFHPNHDILVLDGIPRTAAQARLMEEHIEVIQVVHLASSHPDTMVQRLKKRAQQQNRRDDADENVIRRRLEIYERETTPVLDCYPSDRIAEIDALGTPAQVLRDILNRVVDLEKAPA